MARRLGWIGPAIVAASVAIAAYGAWLILAGRPVAGETIDTLTVDPETTIVVRAEEGGTRNFVELRHGDDVSWQALVPTYGGRRGAPGIAWNGTAVSVRVLRGDKAEVFALAFPDGTKLGGFRLAPNHGAVVSATTGPVTVTDHVRAYEVVGGTDWHQLVAWELSSGEALWREELGPATVDDAGVRDGTVWVRQGSSTRRFRVLDGVPLAPGA